MSLRGSRSSVLVVACAVVGLALTGCGSASPSGASSGGSSAPSIEGTSWVLSSYVDASGATTKPAAGTTASLSFQPASRMSGSTGCNAFGGVWTQDGTALTLTPGATTKKACPGPLAAQETAVLAELQRVATSSLVGSDLTLSGADGSVLLTYAPGITGLSGTSWTATGVNNGKGGVVSVPTGVEVTAEFAADGQVSGSGGCNTYNGPWSTTGTDGLSIGPVVTTLVGCSGDKGTTESAYYAALDAVATYTIEGDSLTLRDKGGATQVTYRLAG